MLEERFRFMYLGKGGTDLKQVSLSRKNFYLFAGIVSCVLLCITAMIIILFTHVFHNVRITILQKDREHLQKELITLKERVSTISEKLATVEKTGDELRNATGLPPIDKDTRQVGVGGPMYYSALDFGYYPDQVGSTAQEVRVDLDKLERSIRLSLTSMTEINSAIQYKNDWVSHFPSINPILGGRITEDFGYRIDPFIGKYLPHEGVDIPMPIGTKVRTTADGIVKSVEVDYRPVSYGINIFIDHGHGFETHYAHLSTALVKAGQRVKRGDVIGEVGQTGKATGPHLHYEVIETGKKTNPQNFIFNDGN